MGALDSKGGHIVGLVEGSLPLICAAVAWFYSLNAQPDPLSGSRCRVPLSDSLHLNGQPSVLRSDHSGWLCCRT